MSRLKVYAVCHVVSISTDRSTSQHRFWVPSEVDEETENPELLAESSSRYISFPGTFTPVSHHCNALLGNGRLCPRQDRVKVTPTLEDQTL
jgi:hypothetical protein